MFSSACRIVKRNFSAVVASSKLDWHDIFDGCFGNSLPGRSVENLSVSSFSSLLDIPERGPCSEIASNRSSQSGLGAEDIQLIKDVGLPQFFGHLIDELSIDHAILFCSKLTGEFQNRGIDTLIKIILEKFNDKDLGVKDKNEIAKRVLQLLLHSRDKHCILSVETNRKLEKWLRNGRDAPSFKNNLQALCHKSMDGDEPISVEETFGDNLTHLDSMGKWSKSLITRKLSDIPGKVGCTDVSYTTGLGNALYKLGKSSSPGRLEERFLQFAQLHQKGVSEKAFRRLIECFARGLIENPGDIARMISVFKNVTGSLRLDLLPSFNIFIGHCANHGKIDLCIDLIQTIKARGLEPCSLSYEPLIKYFARTLQISKAEDILKVMDLSGMQVTVKAYEAVIAAHAKLRNFERAYNLIERIHSGDLKPDLYTPIIFNYAMKGHVSLALSVFHQMKRRGVKPNADNFATLIRACAHRRNSQGAEKAFKLYGELGDFSKEDDQVVMTAMINAYSCCGAWNCAEKLILNADPNVLASHETMCTLMSGFAVSGKSKEALQIYQEIVNGGSLPDPRSFLKLLTSLGNAGEVDQLLHMYETFKESMQGKSQVSQEQSTSLACSTIVHAYIIANQLEKALTFLHRIQTEDAGDVETLCLKVFMEDKGSFLPPEHAPLSLRDKLQFLRAMRERLKIHPTRLAYESLLESCAKEKDVRHAADILQMMISDKLAFNVFTYLIILRIFTCARDSERASALVCKMAETMSEKGLEDKHVKFIILKILKGGNMIDKSVSI